MLVQKFISNPYIFCEYITAHIIMSKHCLLSLNVTRIYGQNPTVDWWNQGIQPQLIGLHSTALEFATRYWM